MADFNFGLETFVRAYIDLHKEGRWFYEADKRFWQDAIDIFSKPGADLQEFFERHRKPESKLVNDVLVFMSGLHNSPDAGDVKNTVKFVTEQVFCPKFDTYSNVYDNTSYLQMFLNRLNKFKDKNLVYEVLCMLKGAVDYKHPSAEKYSVSTPKTRRLVYKDIATMLANNANATTDDIFEMIYFAETSDDALKIINDVFAKTDDDLNAELNKDVPNTDGVGYILNKPKYVVKTVREGRDLSPELVKATEDKNSNKDYYKLLEQWQKIADEKYDFDRVVGSGDAQYVTNYENTLEQQNIDLVNENERLSVDNFKLTQSRDQYRDNYEHEKELRVRLLKKYDDVRAENASLNEMLKNALAVITAYENGENDVDRAGVFNKAAAKVKRKEAIDKANAELKRAQEQDEKRKQALVTRQMQEGQAISI